MNKGTLLVSACLLGVRCRYDGGDCYCPAAPRLMERYDLIPVCPELLGGLPVPRPPAEIRGDRVFRADGTDVTAEFRLGAERTLELARKYGAAKALLKSASPSCGRDMVHDGGFSGKMAAGRGLAAALLMGNGVEVFDEAEAERLAAG